jgi:hypothetical protein
MYVCVCVCMHACFPLKIRAFNLSHKFMYLESWTFIYFSCKDNMQSIIVYRNAIHIISWLLSTLFTQGYSEKNFSLFFTYNLLSTILTTSVSYFLFGWLENSNNM